MKYSIATIIASVIVAASCSKPASATPPDRPAANRYNVTVDAAGYHPSTISVHAGQPATIVFTRTSDEGCGQQVVFPSLNVRRDLPLNQPVEVQLTPTATAIAFTCGMGMLRGSVVVGP